MRLRLLPLLIAACGGTNGVEDLPTADTVERYATDVHPILERRCATLDCHGDPGRPLRLFADTGLRASDALRGQPITAEELAANVRSLLTVDPGTPPAESLLLSKPLAGGAHHVGGEIWAAATEPQPRCFIGWLTASRDAAACEEAAAEVMLPPP